MGNSLDTVNLRSNMRRAWKLGLQLNIYLSFTSYDLDRLKKIQWSFIAFAFYFGSVSAICRYIPTNKKLFVGIYTDKQEAICRYIPTNKMGYRYFISKTG